MRSMDRSGPSQVLRTRSRATRRAVDGDLDLDLDLCADADVEMDCGGDAHLRSGDVFVFSFRHVGVDWTRR